MGLPELIFLGGIFCSLITAYILFFRNGLDVIFSDILLGILLILMSWCSLAYLLIISGWIYQVPYLYKTAAPLNFLIPPIAFIYVRSVIYNEKKIRKTDLFHLIPFILIFINYFSFYSMPFIEKQKLVESVVNNLKLNYETNDGLISENYRYILGIFQGIVYLILQWKTILDFKQEKTGSKFIHQTTEVIKWLKVYNWCSTISIFGYLILILLVKIGLFEFGKDQIILVPGVILSASYFLIASYLLLHPMVLFGLPYLNYTKKEDSKIDINNYSEQNIAEINIEEFENEIKEITTYFEKELPFLKPNITINDIAVATNIPSRELSFIINQYFQKRFTDFVNQYRINYFIKQINNGELVDYKISTIALKAGFTSKSTFNRAFKKEKGCTPSEFENSFPNFKEVQSN
jgi:AraC-like DNA-binding protein